MHKIILIRLLIILTMCFAATAINTKAQTQENDSAKNSLKIQAADDICNQRLAKTLDALEAAESAIKSLQMTIEAQQKLAEINNEIITKKDELTKNQSDLLKIYDREKGTTISFFWGLLKIKKR